GPADLPVRLRPPGSPVREGGRGRLAGARPQPNAALPGDAHPPERPHRPPGAAGPHPDSSPARRGGRALRPLPLLRPGAFGVDRPRGPQPAPLRPPAARAPLGAPRGPPRRGGGGGGAGSVPLRAAALRGGRAPAPP